MRASPRKLLRNLRSEREKLFYRWLMRMPIAQLVLLPVLLILLGVAAAGCRDLPTPDTELFERAEAYLRRGNYEAATQYFEEFLREHPSSLLAPAARQRLQNIDRELEAVMGRRSSPAPIYIRPADPAEAENDTTDSRR